MSDTCDSIRDSGNHLPKLWPFWFLLTLVLGRCAEDRARENASTEINYSFFVSSSRSQAHVEWHRAHTKTMSIATNRWSEILGRVIAFCT